MKKHTLNISIVSVLCVLCAASVGDAFAAGSVRALGGSGTYNGTAAAVNTATASRGATATRSGSLRISPSATRSVSTGTRTNSDGTTTPTERLSIGKYLGGATSVSTSGSSSSSAAAATAAEIAELTTQVNNLYSTTQTIEGDITTLENTKQNALTANDGIVQIVGDVISINMTNLGDELEGMFVKGTDLEIRYDGTSNLEWQYAGTGDWTKLMNLNDLTGTYVSTDQLNNKIEELALEGLAGRVTAAEADIEAIQTALAAKANAADVYAKTETYSKAEVDAALSGVASGEAMTALLAEKQPIATADYTMGTAAGGWAELSAAQKNALDSGVTSAVVAQVGENASDIAALDTAIAGKADADDVYTKAESDTLLGAKANSADVYTAAQTDTLLAAKADSETVTEQLATKADAATVTEQLAAKANAADVYAKTETYSKTEADTLLAGKVNVGDVPTDESFAAATQRITDLETAVAEIPDQQQADWTQTDSDAVDFIKGKPEIYTKSETNTLLEAKADASDLGDLSDDLEELAGTVATNTAGIGTNATAIGILGEAVAAKANTADVNTALAAKANTSDLVQSDWTETDETALSFIQHKPTIPDGVTVDTALSTTSTNAIANMTVTNALPNFDATAGDVVTVPGPNGAYVLGYVNGKPAYIAIVDGNGDTGVDVPWGD